MVRRPVARRHFSAQGRNPGLAAEHPPRGKMPLFVAWSRGRAKNLDYCSGHWPSLSLKEPILERHPSSQPCPTESAAAADVQRRPAMALVGSDVEILTGVQQGNQRAQALLYDKYQRDVLRVLVRILGTSPDVADALQDTFMRAFKSVSQVKAAIALRSWLLRVAVTVAFDQLRRRQRTRWLVFSNEASIEMPVTTASPELRAALHATYGVLNRLPNEERIAFALRHIHGMELEEVAEACDVSLSTIKRRLGKAEIRFRTIARCQPSLASWLGEETP